VGRIVPGRVSTPPDLVNEDPALGESPKRIVTSRNPLEANTLGNMATPSDPTYPRNDLGSRRRRLRSSVAQPADWNGWHVQG